MVIGNVLLAAVGLLCSQQHTYCSNGVGHPPWTTVSCQPESSAGLKLHHALSCPAVTLQGPAHQGVDAARAAVLACDASRRAPAVAYVAKMIAVPAASLPRRAGQDAAGRNPTDEVFLAFGRVFAGTLRDGDRVHVLSAAYDPAAPAGHRQEAQARLDNVCKDRCLSHAHMLRYHNWPTCVACTFFSSCAHASQLLPQQSFCSNGCPGRRACTLAKNCRHMLPSVKTCPL